MGMPKIAAIIVTYHPNKDNLIQNAFAIFPYVDCLLVWRNSEEDLSYIEKLSDNIVLIGDCNNHYLAEPYNYALQWCEHHDYNYLLTMDQDSRWIDLKGFLSDVERYKTSEIAIFAPNINNEIQSEDLLVDRDFVISSGMLIDVSCAKKVGGFNERYQIYWVDGEFCFKIRSQEFEIKVLTKYRLCHELGKQTKTIFGYSTSNYSPLMYYFIVRNMIWEHRQYGNGAVSHRCIFYTLFYNIRGIILGEDNKSKKIFKIIKGLIDGSLKSYQ